MFYVSKRVRSGNEPKMGQSQKVVGLALGVRKGRQNQTCVNDKDIFKKVWVLSKEEVLRAKG